MLGRPFIKATPPVEEIRIAMIRLAREITALQIDELKSSKYSHCGA